MNYLGAGGAKAKIEEVIGDIEKVIIKLDSSLINIDNNEDTLVVAKNKLKSLITSLQNIEQSLIDDSLTMKRIDDQL